jgi:phage head maturation protease
MTTPTTGSVTRAAVTDATVELQAELRHATPDALELRSEDQPALELRELLLRIVPWDQVAQTEQGPELFRRGAFDGIDPTRVVVESQRHGGPLVGAGLELRQDQDAAYLRARIARTAAGDELLELARAGVLRDASVAFLPVPGGSRVRNGVTERHRVDLRRVAVLERGAYRGAEVLAVRTEDTTVDETTTPALTVEAIRAAVREVVADAIPAPVVAVPDPAPAEPILGRVGSFAELYERVMDGDQLLARAIADEITTDVPSIVRPAWLDKLVGIVPGNRPVVSAFGRASLPADGMEVNWPTYDPDDATSDATRVGLQSAQKTDVVSAKIVLGSDKTTVVTYAGGLDISWQTLRRSSPAFREIALRILTASWARVTDKAFAAAIVSKATGSVELPADADGAAYHATLLEASAAVDDATGSPATFVLAAPDAWLAIGKAAGILPPAYGTQNLAGVGQASTLRVEVSGLPILRAKSLAAGTILVSNGEAADYLEDGMFTAQADVVTKLGTDVVVWSLGAPAVYIPSGIVKVAPAGGA